MSASEEESKIDLLDDKAAVKRKLKKAFCEPGNVAENGVLSFTKHVIFRLLEGKDFLIPRSEKNGGNLIYKDSISLETDFANQTLHPGDLKAGVEAAINRLLDPIRHQFNTDPELKKIAQNAYPKKSETITNGPDASLEEQFGRLDIRVGRILSVEKHPDSDKMYVESIDLGDADGPRTVVSGLADHVTSADLHNRLVVALCNLKPAKLRGVESKAMVLCASTPEKVEPLLVPEGSTVGERVHLEGAANLPTPDVQLNPKKKVWEKLQADLKTSSTCTAEWNNVALVTSAGAVKSQSLSNVEIK